MATEKFIVKKGIHNVPNHGRVDCNKKLNQDELVKLYLNKYFASFITPTPEGVALLKKAKLDDKQIAQLIQRAKTPDEVKWLLDVKTTETLTKIADVRISALKEK